LNQVVVVMSLGGGRHHLDLKIDSAVAARDVF